MIDTLLQDLRYAVRSLVKSPAYTALAVLALALGIGVNTAVFSVLNGVVLRPLRHEDAARIYGVWERSERGDYRLASFPTFLDWQEQSDALEALAFIRGTSTLLPGEQGARRVGTAFVSEQFFDVLRGQALFGRTFTPDEFTTGRDRAIVLGYGAWSRQFGGEPSVLGRVVAVLAADRHDRQRPRGIHPVEDVVDEMHAPVGHEPAGVVPEPPEVEVEAVLVERALGRRAEPHVVVDVCRRRRVRLGRHRIHPALIRPRLRQPDRAELCQRSDGFSQISFDSFQSGDESGGHCAHAGGRRRDPDPTGRPSHVFDPDHEAWTKTAGLMDTARTAPSAALLPDGRVLVAGGYFQTESNQGRPSANAAVLAVHRTGGSGWKAGGPVLADVVPPPVGVAMAMERNPAVVKAFVEAEHEIAAVKSPPLTELLCYTVQRSDNHLADGIFRALGRSNGDGSWASGSNAVLAALTRLFDRGPEPSWDGAVLADGSGLSRDDRLSAQLLVSLDVVMTQRAGTRWQDLMAVTGSSGTLRRRLRGTIAEGKVLGKTGSLRDVRSLSGAVVGPDDRRYHFAVVGNGLDAAENAAVRQLQDELLLALAEDLHGCLWVQVADGDAPDADAEEAEAATELKCAA